MPLFKTPTTQGVWLEHWCKQCYRDETECPILLRALKTGRKPVQWDRNSKPQLMQSTYKCHEFGKRPPRTAKGDKQFEDVSMFDDDELASQPSGFVPVDGWPERPNKGKDVDHA